MVNRYSGEEDFRFPALKCRLESFKKFKSAVSGARIELEGVFVYKSAYPTRNPVAYNGFLDLREEYRLLGLKPPEKECMRINCSIPKDLVSRSSLASKPNMKVAGTVLVDRKSKLPGHGSFGSFDPSFKNKCLVAEEIEFLPIEYEAVGSPAFLDFDDMFSCIYSRSPEIHEYGPMLLLASLIGSERRSLYFPDENVGCGINVAASSEDLPGKVGSGRITSSMKKQLGDFIKKANIGPVNRVSEQFRWNRFTSVKDQHILSRNLQTENEIDWNLITDVDKINRLKNSHFITSDMNLVFDPGLFPRRIGRDELKNLKQALLFAKSIPPMPYEEKANAWIENKTDSVIRKLARRFDYAPFLFRYRFEPLCDAFLKGSHLEDCILGGDMRIRKKDVDSFFRQAEDAAWDFADYAQDYVEESAFSAILDSAKDSRLRDLLRELLVKGGMSEDAMVQYLIDRHDIIEKKADSLVSHLLHAEPVLLVRQGRFFKPIP